MGFIFVSICFYIFDIFILLVCCFFKVVFSDLFFLFFTYKCFVFNEFGLIVYVCLYLSKFFLLMLGVFIRHLILEILTLLRILCRYLCRGYFHFFLDCLIFFFLVFIFISLYIICSNLSSEHSIIYHLSLSQRGIPFLNCLELVGDYWDATYIFFVCINNFFY